MAICSVSFDGSFRSRRVVIVLLLLLLMLAGAGWCWWSTRPAAVLRGKLSAWKPTNYRFLGRRSVFRNPAIGTNRSAGPFSTRLVARRASTSQSCCSRL